MVTNNVNWVIFVGTRHHQFKYLAHINDIITKIYLQRWKKTPKLPLTIKAQNLVKNSLYVILENKNNL